MRILFLASEVAPFSKTGGLADVAGALPAALAELGHEVLVATPAYGSIAPDGIAKTEHSFRLKFPFGEVEARLLTAQISERHRVMFIDQPDYFHRSGLYQDKGGDYHDNHRRFGFFTMAALTGAQAMGFHADVLHLNDWQTGLAALALKRAYANTPLSRMRSVFTIHNLAYQGLFPKSVMNDLGLPWELFSADGLEFHGSVNFLKAGIMYADALTTVSPTYAREIQTAEGGSGLDGILRERSQHLRGILNGVDYADWNPANDTLLPARFSARDLSGKAECRKALLAQVGLPESAQRAPVFGSISRLVDQKGIELILGVLPSLIQRGASIVLLGSGEARFEHALLDVMRHHPANVVVKIGYDHALSHLIEAGSDFFLMPSRFEPCGLNQMYSLAYASLPIVRATGGLDDTVVDAAQPHGTGFKFGPYTVEAFKGAIDRAWKVFEDPPTLERMRIDAMACDYSWKKAALEYESLYRALTDAAP